MKRLVLLLGVAALFLASCGTQSVGEMHSETQAVDLENAQSVAAELRMGAGELNVSGGAPQLMEADFTYNVPEWEPDVSYGVNGEEGDLRVEQPSTGGGIDLTGDARNEWDIHLNDQIPTDLTVRMGAGESNFTVGSLTLTGLAIEMGAGASTVDMRGEWDRDLDATIRGGAGSVTLHLPTNVGVRVAASGGLGEIEARGLTRQEDAYVNEAYGDSEVTLEVDFEGGVGKLSLLADE